MDQTGIEEVEYILFRLTICFLIVVNKITSLLQSNSEYIIFAHFFFLRH